MYKSIDLFAGIGGIRLGFEQAFNENINTVFVSEWDKYAQKTYKENFNEIKDLKYALEYLRNIKEKIF